MKKEELLSKRFYQKGDINLENLTNTFKCLAPNPKYPAITEEMFWESIIKSIYIFNTTGHPKRSTLYSLSLLQSEDDKIHPEMMSLTEGERVEIDFKNCLMPVYPVHNNSTKFDPYLMFYFKKGDWIYGEDLRSKKAILGRLFRVGNETVNNLRAIGIYVSEFIFEEMNFYNFPENSNDHFDNWRAASVNKVEYETFEPYIHFQSSHLEF
jgi:hypothetical protein